VFVQRDRAKNHSSFAMKDDQHFQRRNDDQAASPLGRQDLRIQTGTLTFQSDLPSSHW
jgi:hypothetical protein